MILNFKHKSEPTGKMPKYHLMSQIVLNIRHTSEPTGKNAQIALELTIFNSSQN